MAIKFNNVDIPAFVRVNSVKVSALPPVSQTTIKVNGRAGNYDFGNQLDSRTIEVAISIIASSPSDLKDKIRQFAEWLYHEEAKELVILSEADKHYMAKFTGDSQLDEIIRYGQGTIQFVCTDPFAYGNEITYIFNPTNSTPVQITNNGTVDTFPQIHVEFTSDTTSFNIVTDEERMIFGIPKDVAITMKDPNPILLNDNMTTLTGWTTATSVDNGIVVGNFQIDADGQSFIQNTGTDGNEDYGTGSGWHGASAIKALSAPTTDFKVTAEIGIEGNVADHLGRVELYLLDINGAKIGKISMLDSSASGLYPKAIAMVGSTSGTNHTFVDSYGQYAGYWKDFSKGVMEIERIGNKWRAYYAILDANGKHIKTWQTYFTDINNISTAQLAQIQIHVGAYSTYTALNTLKFYDLKVFSHDEPTSTELPMVFKVGDKLDINCETGEILKNGVPYYLYFDPSSSFIKLRKGVNGVAITPAITTNGTIKFKERWL